MPATWKLTLGHIWCSSLSLVGLLCALLGGASFYKRRPCGSFWFVGDSFFWGWFFETPAPDGRYRTTITLGAVTVTASRAKDNPAVIRHEREHLYQQMILGPIYPVAYGTEAILCMANGQDPLLQNPFEKAAYEAQKDLDT